MRKEYEWSVQLRTLRRQCGFDFAGLACAIRGRRTLLTWREASGNRNRNYLKIVLEPGKGIAGGVFQRRKAMVVQNALLQYSESERVHTPILLAEDIQSFAAFPLWKDGEVDAVLMLGMRVNDSVTRERYEQLQQILSEGIFGRRVIPESYEAALDEVWRQEYRELPIYELVDVPLRAALREERSRIAQDLHDSVIQDLLGVQMQLRTLKYTDAMEEIREGLQLADTSLSHIQKELREILVSVKPEIVETLGLKAAFLRHFRFMEASYQITVDFQENIGDRRFGSDIETVVYRIGQEAAANACKYAGTELVLARLYLDGNMLRLEIRDSGKGFDADNLQISGGGMGLPGMYYWAGNIGASLTVRSAPDLGTSVLLEVEVP